MTSPAKIAANRRNALRSTGPRTPAGKLVVAQNAIRHGVFANLPVVRHWSLHMFCWPGRGGEQGEVVGQESFHGV